MLQLAVFCQVLRNCVVNFVIRYKFRAFRHAQTVAIAVKGEPDVKVATLHIIHQHVGMRCAAVHVYFASARLGIERRHVRPCAHKHLRCHTETRPVTAIQRDTQTAQIGTNGTQHVLGVNVVDVVKYRLAHTRQFVRRQCQSVHQRRYRTLALRAKLYAVSVKHLQPVVRRRIVACRNHYAEVRAELSHEMRHCVGRQYAYVYYVAAAVVHACRQCTAQFIARCTRVTTNDNYRTLVPEQR